MNKPKKLPPESTIIYCTANIENPEFEDKVIANLVKNSGGLPIISVSRKPIKLGKNICVTEKASISKSSFLRQLLKGLKAAKTEFSIIAKADTLYPPEYFTFVPTLKNRVYSYDNTWKLGDKFWQKDYSESAQMCSTKYWIKMITKALKGHNNWKPYEVPPVFKTTTEFNWTSENPVVTFYTKNSWQKFGSIKIGTLPRRNLPYWGSAENLKKEYLQHA